MEFDLDYESVFWDGKQESVSERGIEIIKVILKSDLDEFSERQIANLLGVRRVRLERLWKAGLLKKYEAIRSGTRPQAIYAPDYQAILYALSGDPEIRDLLQERARRKQSVIQTDYGKRGGFIQGNHCVPRRASPKRRPR